MESHIPKSQKFPVFCPFATVPGGGTEVCQRGTGAGPQYVPCVPEVKLSRMSQRSIAIHHVRVVTDVEVGLVERNNELGAALGH